MVFGASRKVSLGGRRPVPLLAVGDSRVSELRSWIGYRCQRDAGRGDHCEGTLRVVGARLRSGVRVTCAVVIIFGVAACGASSYPSSSSTTPTSTTPVSTATPTTSSTVPASTMSTVPVTATVLPVGSCSIESGTPSSGPAWVPTQLAGSVPAGVASQVEFYSVGTETVLGPAGWSCGQLAGADGSDALDVYPPGQPNPVNSQAQPGEQMIAASYDYTAHIPGVDLACPNFPWVVRSGESCPSAIPSGESVTHLSSDVVSIVDPSHLHGNLPGSGGAQPVTAVMIVPHAPNRTSVSIAEEACSLIQADLCPVILNDFLVRQFPVPTSPES